MEAGQHGNAEIARYVVGTGEALTAFALGPLVEVPYAGDAAPMPDWDDYVFLNGYVDVPQMPCRTALRAELARRGAPEFPVVEPLALNLPDISRRLEFNGFWHEPTRLARAVRTWIIPDAAGPLRLRLATCGGVYLWLDGALVAAFEPYTRNSVAEREVVFEVPAEGGELVLLMEEMAERDTVFVAGLTHVSGPALTLEPSWTLTNRKARDLAALAAGLRPGQHVFGSGELIRLAADHAPEDDVMIEAGVIPSDHLTHHPPLATFSARMAAGDMTCVFGPSDAVPDGYHPLALSIGTAPHLVERKLAVAKMSGPATDWAVTLADRKRQALEHAADAGEPRAGRLLAHLVLGRPWESSCAAILADTLDIVVRRKDCSDFVLVPLLWCLSRHPGQFPDAAYARAREAVLGYRYWMDEPGNDVMWFWSENHVLCFHVSQYLAGRAFPDEVFPNAGCTGRDHMAAAEVRLARWFDAVEPHGLAEWNSAAYYPIDFIGLFALSELTDGALKRRAVALLDRIFTMVALHAIGGVSAGSMGRAYDKELRAGPLPELAPFAAVAFGRGWRTRGVAALPMFAASDYLPPEGLHALAEVPEGQAIEAGYVQGHGAIGRLHLWKSASIQLSVGSGGAPGARGHQQHVIDVQASADPFARLWINHPGEDDPFGSHRPSHWAGNGIMPKVGADGPRALLLYRLGDDPVRPWTHAYAPRAAFDEVIDGPDWCVLRSGQGVIVLHATGPLDVRKSGTGAGCEMRLGGPVCGWAVWVGEVSAHGIGAQVERAGKTRLSLDGAGQTLALLEPDTEPLRLNWTDGLSRGSLRLPGPPDRVDPVIRNIRL